MNVKDLEIRQGNVDIVVEVTDKGEVREFQKFGKTGRVCNATVKDETGEVKLTLWNEDIDKVNVGDKIQLTNGYVNEFQGEKQVTTGKFGKLEIVGESEGGAAPESSTEEAPAEEKAPEEEVEAESETSAESESEASAETEKPAEEAKEEEKGEETLSKEKKEKLPEEPVTEEEKVE